MSFHVPAHIIIIGERFVANIALDSARVGYHVPEVSSRVGENLVANVTSRVAQVRLVMVATLASFIKRSSTFGAKV
jgi:hypothetical protein